MLVEVVDTMPSHAVHMRLCTCVFFEEILVSNLTTIYWLYCHLHTYCWI